MATKNSSTTRTGKRRAVAADNPPATKTVEPKANGNGDAKAKPEPAKANGKSEMETAIAKAEAAAIPTIIELLTKRLKGVGKATADKALEATSIKGTAQATPEQLDRANKAPKDKAGLTGNALALWVLTGKSDGGIEPEQPAVSTTRSRSDEIPASLLDQYLKEQVSGDERAPLQELPTVDEEGTLRIKAPHWQAWLAEHGHEVGRSVATKVLREAGLTAERWPTMPNGNRMMYVGSVPQTAPKRLPRRKDVLLPESAGTGSSGGGGNRSSNSAGRKASALASLNPLETEVIQTALTALKPSAKAFGSAENAKTAGEVRDSLIKRMEA